MILVHFDTEFTHLWDALTPEPAGLISIGCITESGEYFYAENANYQEVLCSDFVLNTVIPLLEGGEKSMSYADLAQQLKAWIESMNDQVFFISDSPQHDFTHVLDLFNAHGWPHNLNRKCHGLRPSGEQLDGYKKGEFKGLSRVELERFFYEVEDIFGGDISLRRHHAGDDARVNLQAYLKVKVSNAYSVIGGNAKLATVEYRDVDLKDKETIISVYLPEKPAGRNITDPRDSDSPEDVLTRQGYLDLITAQGSTSADDETLSVYIADKHEGRRIVTRVEGESEQEHLDRQEYLDIITGQSRVNTQRKSK
jgi:hypothetical protein